MKEYSYVRSGTCAARCPALFPHSWRSPNKLTSARTWHAHVARARSTAHFDFATVLLMNEHGCTAYHYWNADAATCEPCSEHQEVLGTISWCIFGLCALFLCCGYKMVVCPAVTAFAIACNQTYCDARWEPVVSRGLVFIQFLVTCLTIGVVSAQCKACRARGALPRVAAV